MESNLDNDDIWINHAKAYIYKVKEKPLKSIVPQIQMRPSVREDFDMTFKLCEYQESSNLQDAIIPEKIFIDL
jgi:hypothetical protein